MHRVVRRRCESRKRFTTYGEVLEAVVFHVRGELEADLRGHERVRDTFLVEVAVEVRQVQTHVFGDDIDGRAGSERRIEIHHVCIKTEGRVGSDLIAGVQVVVALVPMTERHEVAMLKHHALGHAGGTTGVKEDK